MLWFVVNHWRTKDPASRGQVLAGADGDVEVFAEANGAIIETGGLFRLLQHWDDGLISADKARLLLRQARGRFDFG